MAAAIKVNPNTLARTLSRDLKRTITPKGVRTVARSILPRFDKTKHPAYQSHEYSADEARRIRADLTGKGQRATAQPKRATPKRKATPKVTTTAVAS